MFDNTKFEDLILKKDIEGIKLYLQYNITSGNPDLIFASAKAACFYVLKTKLPLDFLSEIQDRRFSEMLRRSLFSYMRNNSPGIPRQRARKALAKMGFFRAEKHELALSPLAWALNETLYRYELTKNPNAFAKIAKLIVKNQDPYGVASAVKLIENYTSEISEELLAFLCKEEYASNANMLDFLKKAGKDISVLEHLKSQDDKSGEKENGPSSEETASEERKSKEERRMSRFEQIKIDMQKKREEESKKKK